MGSASGLAIRVIWDGAVIEEQAFHGRGEVRIGAGSSAQAVTPGRAGRYVRFCRVGDELELRVEPGAADRLIFDGDEPVELGALKVSWIRRVDPRLAYGRFEIGDTTVEFEPIGLVREARDRVLVAWALAAMVMAMFAGGSYRIVRLLETGWHNPSDDEKALSLHQAAILRVRIGPDGEGSSRPQAGAGQQLVAHADALDPERRATTPSKVEPAVAVPAITPAKHHRPRKRRPPHPIPEGLPSEAPTEVSALDDPPPPQMTPEDPPSRDKLLADAQAALLDADVRTAADDYSRASESGELSFDQLTLLGLAQYLQPSLDEAERTWQKARDLEPQRADALVNLSHIAKRRGDHIAEARLLRQALELAPESCNALNSLALSQARQGDGDGAEATRHRAEEACGSDYAFGHIHHAAMLSLAGDASGALKELTVGLATVDHMIPVKEFEVYSDLTLDPAFANLRHDPRFQGLVERYLPRALKVGAAARRRG